jgi:hypothetical protein
MVNFPPTTKGISMYRIIAGADGSGGDPYLPNEYDLLHTLAGAVQDGACKIEFRPGAGGGDDWYRVELLDGEEWGEGATMEIALRYALGSHVYQIQEAIS